METEKTKNIDSTDHVVVAIDPPKTNPKSQSPQLRRLNLSKPKSRFQENSKPQIFLKHTDSSTTSSSSSSDDDEWYGKDNEDEDEDEKINNKKKMMSHRRSKRRINKRAAIEWALFLAIMACLICSLTLEPLRRRKKWSIEVWKWCLMIMVLFCGRLVAGWVVLLAVFLIERNFMLKEKVLYFVYGLRRSFRNCVWLGLVLVAWLIMFPDVNAHSRALRKAFRFLVGVLVGATIWLLKIVAVKVLASSFHVAAFFDRMKESVFNHYILDALSGPPLDEEEREEQPAAPRRGLRASRSMPGRLRREKKAGGGGEGAGAGIDMEKLRRLSMESRPTAWTVRRLVSYVRSSGLSTISRTVDDFGKAESEITSEWEARSCAKRTFKNVAKPGAKYIEMDDLLRFLKSEEVYTIFPLFEGSESGKISKSSFRNWVVHAYVERKALAHSLNDTKTAVQQLHKLASAVVVVVIAVVSLLVMGVATTKVIFVVTSQLLLVGFMFQNMCKTIFESIIFVFVMHPFDVGDRCVVDGIQMVVEEMNILTTVFLRFDNEKIYYPNAVLLTKPISNFRRSPDMADTVEFCIDVATPADDIAAMRKAIQTYIESKPKYWSPKHSVIIKEIENVNRMKIGLYVQHTMNHQNYGEKSSRRSELVFELKKIFENLQIKYHLLPQEVHLTQFNVVTNASNVATMASL